MAKRFLAVLLTVCMVFSLSACTGGSGTYTRHNMNYSSAEKTITASFMEEDTSEIVSLSSGESEKLKKYLKDINTEFPYNNLFETDECYNRLNTEIKVKKHKFSALDKSGKLDSNHLLGIVKKNNIDYLSDSPFGLEAPEDGYILDVCKLIVDTISSLKDKFPDIDYKRVYCNLGNLKILYKKGMVDNAQVSADMVLKISPNMLEIVDNMKGEGASRDVLMHEIMHKRELK